MYIASKCRFISVSRRRRVRRDDASRRAPLGSPTRRVPSRPKCVGLSRYARVGVSSDPAPPRVPDEYSIANRVPVVPEYYSRAHSRAPGKATARAHPRSYSTRGFFPLDSERRRGGPPRNVRGEPRVPQHLLGGDALARLASKHRAKRPFRLGTDARPRRFRKLALKCRVHA